LALGFAVGACVNFFPTFGFGIPFAGVAAGLVLASIPAGLLGDIIFKPLFPVFFYLNMVTGSLLWGHRTDMVYNFRQLVRHPDISTFTNAGVVFFSGAVLNSLVLGTIIYIGTRLVVERYRPRVLQWLISKSGRKRSCA